MQNRTVGLRDIAEESGVSVTTVSKILGGRADLFADKTVAKVRLAAARLNYRPSATARSLKRGCTDTAGVMVPLVGFFSHILNGIHSTLFEPGHAVLLGTTPKINTAGDDDTEARIIHQLIERNVDGIILRPSSEQYERAYFDEIWQRNIPLIAVDREMSLFKTDFVGSDDEAIGYMAAQYLADLGHRRLLFVAAPGVSTSQQRAMGFRCAVAEMADISCRRIVAQGAWPELAALMLSDERPTGVFCYCDGLAAHFLARLAEWGLRVPEDVSVVGAGDTIAYPGLTTFDQQPFEIGRRAAQLYLNLVKMDCRPASPTIVRLPAKLIPRATTASYAPQGS